MKQPNKETIEYLAQTLGSLSALGITLAHCIASDPECLCPETNKPYSLKLEDDIAEAMLWTDSLVSYLMLDREHIYDSMNKKRDAEILKLRQRAAQGAPAIISDNAPLISSMSNPCKQE